MARYEKIDVTKDIKVILEKAKEIDPTIKLFEKRRAQIQYIIQDWLRQQNKNGETASWAQYTQVQGATL